MTSTELFVATDHTAETVGDYVILKRQVDSNPFLHEPEVRFLFQHCFTAVDYALRKGADISFPLTLDHFGMNGSVGSFRVPRFRDLKPNQRKSIETLAYSPPEMLPESGTHAGIQVLGSGPEKACVWSMGIAFYFLLFCQFPFDARTRYALDATGQERLEEMARSIKEAKLDLAPAIDQLLPEIASLLRWMLDPNPETRISMNDIMQTPWFQRGLASYLVGINDRLLSRPKEMNLPCEMESIKEIFSRISTKISS